MSRSPNSANPVIPIKTRPSRRLDRAKGKFRQYVGLPYEPPHGCFLLVARIYQEIYGIDLQRDVNDLPHEPRALLGALHQHLATLATEVSSGNEVEGDIVLLRTSSYHIGMIVEPGWMIHVYETPDDSGTTVIESYHAPEWRNNVMGFYRYDCS